MEILLPILLLPLIIFEVIATLPQERYSGAAVLLNKKIYSFGGRPSARGNQSQTIQELIYLDIFKSFNVSEAQDDWQGIQPSGDLQPESNYAHGMGSIPEENSIMIYGGKGDNEPGVFLNHTAMVYNTRNDTWSSLDDPQAATLRQVHGGTCSGGNNHKAYVFGGTSWNLTLIPPFDRHMFVYDFKQAAWSSISLLPDNINYRYNCPTTLVGNDLYYIGGMTADYNQTSIINPESLVLMTDILIFHIDNSSWELKKATSGEIPDPRVSHTISAKPNSQEIIMFGGKVHIPDTKPIENFCYVLDIPSMTWTKKAVFGQGPGALYGHSAVFAENSQFLFIMFGVNSYGVVQNGFGILDTETWEWSNKYTSPYDSEDVNGSSDSESSNSNGSNSNGIAGGAIAGIVVGCAAGVGLLVALLFFIRKRRNRNGKNQKKMVGSELNEIAINNNTAIPSGDDCSKPEDTNHDIPNAILSPLLPKETIPPYRGQIPNELHSPVAFVENTENGRSIPRIHNHHRPVKPDGD